jgi:formate dehydrogenase iron-sulfur subunit
MPAMGFMTDTTLCIGCKACEVACKEWNQLPATNGGANTMSGDSYDNTRRLDGENWRHVKFVEQFDVFDPNRNGGRWLLMSDVCKHCVQAGCLEVCPTGAIIRTEFDTVVIQSDVCNGCRYCIAACPFDVIGINQANNTAMKCTLCYDRLQGGLTPACAQACPTASIQFGPLHDLKARGAKRVQELHAKGETRAYLYGVEGDGYTDQIGGLNAFFLLVDPPETYRLPSRPTLPSKSTVPDWLAGWGGALVAGMLGLLALRQRRMTTTGAAPEPVRATSRSNGDEDPARPPVAPGRPAAPPPRRNSEYTRSDDQGEA